MITENDAVLDRDSAQLRTAGETNDQVAKVTTQPDDKIDDLGAEIRADAAQDSLFYLLRSDVGYDGE